MLCQAHRTAGRWLDGEHLGRSSRGPRRHCRQQTANAIYADTPSGNTKSFYWRSVRISTRTQPWTL
jgi:hypothetical protein